jgi:hypothetical protein
LDEDIDDTLSCRLYQGPPSWIQNRMSTKITRPAVRSRARLRVGMSALAIAALGGAGLGARSLAHHSEPAPEAMSAIPTPCDGFMDCVYTAYWYYFLR